MEKKVVMTRLLLYDAVLMATGYSNGAVSEYSKKTVRRLLDENKAYFAGGAHEIIGEALEGLAGGTPVPEPLREAVYAGIYEMKQRSMQAA